MKWNMKMMRHSRMLCDEIDDLGNNFQRFDGTHPQPFKSGNFKGPANQLIKAGPRRKITAICSKMNSRKNHLFVAAPDKVLYFRDGGIQFDASAPASNRRNN